MANKIDVIIQHALRTFTRQLRKVPEGIPTEIIELKTLTDDLTSRDISKLRGLMNAGELKEFLRRKKTNLDYLSVYEDDDVSVGVFLLRQGAKLPMHDHPNMHGIIKVLEGILKVTSYSLVEMDTSIVVDDRSMFFNHPLKVVKYPEVLLGNEDRSCLLTPTDRNIHEVECVEGPAAFLDILSPPYANGMSNEPRTCHYFQEMTMETDGVMDMDDDYLRLVQVESPFQD